MFTLTTKDLSETVTLKNLPTLRQTFFVGSVVIMLGYVLEDVYPITHYLPLLPAIGLMVSALTGFCPMAYFLQKLPWNKVE
ncbi:DUF2892 domain-containing protein [Candidatus Kaiserbacteria bacterium]|nr:DUF2892 domain-containing protein [Candidatus Kaiserbacteria bacterium]MCB9812425.1 DUF2892 domain-containing protein [Candidatus Nomurabacteria bacterium]